MCLTAWNSGRCFCSSVCFVKEPAGLETGRVRYVSVVGCRRTCGLTSARGWLEDRHRDKEALVLKIDKRTAADLYVV